MMAEHASVCWWDLERKSDQTLDVPGPKGAFEFFHIEAIEHDRRLPPDIKIWGRVYYSGTYPTGRWRVKIHMATDIDETGWWEHFQTTFTPYTGALHWFIAPGAEWEKIA